MYINTVHFFSKPWGGAESNPMRSLVSDQCYFYAKYDKNYASTSIGVLRGGPRGPCPPPPKIDYKCSKLEVAAQQGVVNSRSSTNKVYQSKKFLEIFHNIDYLFDKHR